MPHKQANSAGLKQVGSGVDLLLDIRGRHVRAGLATALREAIETGRLSPGARLPATRSFAAELGVSRSSVTECYAELIAEGWLVARQGSGTRVADIVRKNAGDAAVNPTVSPGGRGSHGLLPGAPEFADFPRQHWLSAARRALATASVETFGYGDPAGVQQLRRALSDYLGRVRGVRADPDQIVITSGFHAGLTILAQALKAHDVEAVAAENYGLGLYRQILSNAGFDVPAVFVDSDGARTSELPRSQARAVLLTPAHQFPTGAALSPDRRASALNWARANDAWILEDDYDGEFRYDRAPVAALQGLDPDRVVYFGTSSKSLAPALRMAWMVVPRALLPEVLRAKGPVDTVSTVEQLTLADFIASGRFDRHVRAKRHKNRRRLDQLVSTVTQASPQVAVRGIAAGLQTLLELPKGSEALVVRAAEKEGLLLSPLTDFRYVPEGHDPVIDAGIVVNFSAVSDASWDVALTLLARVLRESLSTPA